VRCRNAIHTPRPPKFSITDYFAQPEEPLISIQQELAARCKHDNQSSQMYVAGSPELHGFVRYSLMLVIALVIHQPLWVSRSFGPGGSGGKNAPALRYSQQSALEETDHDEHRQ
jgi:hypothetical protein